jgi:hypothetical protein
MFKYNSWHICGLVKATFGRRDMNASEEIAAFIFGKYPEDGGSRFLRFIDR